MLMEKVISVPLVVMLVVGVVCLVVLSFLDGLLLVVNTSLGEVTTLSPRGATDHGLSFVVLVLLHGSGFPMVVLGWIGLIGRITVLIGAVRWMLLTPLLRRWLGIGLTLLVLTPVLSLLLALALGFELQVGGSMNMWLISGVVLRPYILVVSRRYITFGDGEQGRGTSEGMIKINKLVTLKCVALVKPLGSFCSLPYLVCGG
jgi:hypothetical protein